jgi:hypothetical protein
MTLRDWILFVRGCDPARLLGRLIVNCSKQDGSDGALPFTIGMGYRLAQIMQQRARFLSRLPTPRDRPMLVSAGFSTTTDVRRRGPVREQIEREILPRLGVANRMQPPSAFFEELSRSKFAISPEGNGIDCHRHYEAILLGAVPVVEDSELARGKYAGCPVLFTKDSYADLDIEGLEATHADLCGRTFDFSRLFWASHPAAHRRAMAANGRFWVARTVPVWYLKHGRLLYVG